MPARRRSGKDILRDNLTKYGLAPLTNWWWTRRQQGWSDQELWLAIRDTRTYKTRFAGLEEARKAGFGVSEAAYIQFERTVRGFARQYEIPRTLIDKLIPKWVAGGTAPTEVLERLEANLASVDNYVAGNPQVQAELAAAKQLYGIQPTRGDLLAMALDPSLGQREAVKRLRAVSAGAAATVSGFGELSRLEAEEIAGYGVEADEAEEGFGTLIEAEELFGALDAGEDEITRREQFGATFGGNQAARRRIQQRARRRSAGFESGGGFAGTREGLSGLGSAST